VNAFVRFSYERLREHPLNRERVAQGLLPANIILPRGAGVAPHLDPSLSDMASVPPLSSKQG
jgi:2,3-bisphosphoglycerate-independent phosphoglycerate mutase